MGWLSRFLRRPRSPAPRASDEAIAARRAAEAGLRNDLDRWPEVTRVTESLRRTRADNHFSEAIERLWRTG